MLALAQQTAKHLAGPQAGGQRRAKGNLNFVELMPKLLLCLIAEKF